MSKAPDKFRQLWKHILAVSDGLQKWADGAMRPDSKDDAIAVKGIPYPLCVYRLPARASTSPKLARLFVKEKGKFVKKSGTGTAGAKKKYLDSNGHEVRGPRGRQERHDQRAR